MRVKLKGHQGSWLIDAGKYGMLPLWLCGEAPLRGRWKLSWSKVDPCTGKSCRQWPGSRFGKWWEVAARQGYIVWAISLAEHRQSSDGVRRIPRQYLGVYRVSGVRWDAAKKRVHIVVHEQVAMPA
jgi:hypothetical protein